MTVAVEDVVWLESCCPERGVRLRADRSRRELDRLRDTRYPGGDGLHIWISREGCTLASGNSRLEQSCA